MSIKFEVYNKVMNSLIKLKTDDTLIGSINLDDSGDGKTVYIDIWINREQDRSMGYGSLLLQTAEQEYLKRGYTTFRGCMCPDPSSEKGNISNLSRFYSKNNYTIDGENICKTLVPSDVEYSIEYLS